MQLQRRSRIITREAHAWVLNLSRRTPRDLGAAPTEWSLTNLAARIRSDCRAAGHPSLAGITYGTLSKLLACDSDQESEGA